MWSFWIMPLSQLKSEQVINVAKPVCCTWYTNAKKITWSIRRAKPHLYRSTLVFCCIVDNSHKLIVGWTYPSELTFGMVNDSHVSLITTTVRIQMSQPNLLELGTSLFLILTFFVQKAPISQLKWIFSACRKTFCNFTTHWNFLNLLTIPPGFRINKNKIKFSIIFIIEPTTNFALFNRLFAISLPRLFIESDIDKWNANETCSNFLFAIFR